MNNLMSTLKNFSVLAVEDDKETLEWFSTILKMYFKEVYLGRDGAEGISLFKKHQPDLVITDIRMAGIDGLSMSRAIKDLNPKTPIIITTAHSSENYLSEIIQLERIIYIKKPIDIDEILVGANNFFKCEKNPLGECVSFDRESMSLKIEGEERTLTKNELNLFELLYEKSPNLISKEMIEARIWREQTTPEALRVLVTALRKKIKPLEIKNSKGLGYRLTT